jgi:hypothetical protein
MADCKYLVFRATGKRQALMERIRQHVRAEGLGMEIPMVKFEPGHGKQFYLGIAVHVDDPAQTEPTSRVIKFLEHARLGHLIRNDGAKKNAFFEPEDIEKFLHGSFDWESFNQRLIFEIDNSGEGEEPDYDTREWPCATVNQDLLNKLLWWCSAKGEGSYRVFKNACSMLGLEEVREGAAWSLLRSLVLLGHLEFSAVNGRISWGAVPTCIVRPRNAPPYLAGKQTPMVVDELGRILELHQDSSNGGPARWSVSEHSLEAMGLMEGIVVVDEPAEGISNLLLPFEEWFDGLEEDPDLAPHRYTLKRFNGREFVPIEDASPPAGLYEATRHEGHSAKPVMTYFDGNRWLRAGFYDLRWIASRKGEDRMTVALGKDGALLVPAQARWPLLYERALVLASGKLPRIVMDGNTQRLAYDGIGSGLARKLSDLLGIELVEL